jgi:hypothetical protein
MLARYLVVLATLTDGMTEPWLICGDFNTAASSWPGDDRALVMSPAKLTYPADEAAEAIDDTQVLPGSLRTICLCSSPHARPVREVPLALPDAIGAGRRAVRCRSTVGSFGAGQAATGLIRPRPCRCAHSTR